MMQYVLTVDVTPANNPDPATLSMQISDAVSEAIAALPGVDAVQTVGVA
jgi:hypothetical protein